MEVVNRFFEAKNNENPNFAIDTSFVLFFLAVDLGQNLVELRFDTFILAMTLMAVVVLPYFMTSDKKSNFGNWLIGRCLIILFALILGLMFRQALGVVFPEAFSFLPLTLLILAAMFSCYFQFYGFFKLRLSK